jgi:hypothetical protein
MQLDINTHLTGCKLMWLQRELPRAENDDLEVLLQLKLDREETTLLGTSGNGFVVWEFGDGAHRPNQAVVLPLPHGVRNISTRMLCSNSCMVSAARDYVIAGVRLTKVLQIFNHTHTHTHTHIHFLMHSLQKGIEVPGTQLLYVNGCSDSNFM